MSTPLLATFVDVLKTIGWDALAVVIVILVVAFVWGIVMDGKTSWGGWREP